MHKDDLDVELDIDDGSVRWLPAFGGIKAYARSVNDSDGGKAAGGGRTP